MLRDPERPFYVPGQTFREQFSYAQEHCDQLTKIKNFRISRSATRQ